MLGGRSAVERNGKLKHISLCSGPADYVRSERLATAGLASDSRTRAESAARGQ